MSVLHLINGGQLQTGYKIKEAQWKGEKVVKHPDADIIKPHYGYCWSSKKVHCRLQDTYKQICLEMIGSLKNSVCFTEYLLHRADQYREKGMIVMDKKLRRFAFELSDSFKGDVYFGDITQTFFVPMKHT